jgi:hypothetical protein
MRSMDCDLGRMAALRTSVRRVPKSESIVRRSRRGQAPAGAAYFSQGLRPWNALISSKAPAGATYERASVLKLPQDQAQLNQMLPTLSMRDLCRPTGAARCLQETGGLRHRLNYAAPSGATVEPTQGTNPGSGSTLGSPLVEHTI